MNSLKGAMAALLFAVIVSFIALLPELTPEPRSVYPEAGQVQPTFHDIGYENAWIQFVDTKERLVQVQASSSRIVIVFRPKNRRDISRFREGWITPVTFLCRDGSTDCEIGSQTKTYVGNVEVEPTVWKTIGGRIRLDILSRPTP
jgi:hypothetical protein